MALPIWQRTITTASGDLVPNAEITVVNEATGLGATIFSNREGTTPLGTGGVFFTGSDGFAQFYAAAGEYRVTAAGVSGSQTWRWIALVGDAAFMANDTDDDTLRTAASYDAATLATPDTVVLRDENGTTEFADATEDQHPVTLGQLEAEVLSFSDLQWLGTAVREYKIMHITDLNQLPETDNPLYRYVLLSADQAGVGDYNEGVLINQATDSSSGREDITAEINLPASPMHGQTVRLVNSMEAFFKAGELAGAFSADQMQLLTGDFSAGSNSGFVGTSVRSGVFSDLGDAFGDNVLATQAGSPRKMAFDSSNSPDARTSATTEGATEPLSVTTVVLLRIL